MCGSAPSCHSNERPVAEDAFGSTLNVLFVSMPGQLEHLLHRVLGKTCEDDLVNADTRRKRIAGNGSLFSLDCNQSLPPMFAALGERLGVRCAAACGGGATQMNRDQSYHDTESIYGE